MNVLKSRLRRKTLAVALLMTSLSIALYSDNIYVRSSETCISSQAGCISVVSLDKKKLLILSSRVYLIDSGTVYLANHAQIHNLGFLIFQNPELGRVPLNGHHEKVNHLDAALIKKEGQVRFRGLDSEIISLILVR